MVSRPVAEVGVCKVGTSMASLGFSALDGDSGPETLALSDEIKISTLCFSSVLDGVEMVRRRGLLGWTSESSP